MLSKSHNILCRSRQVPLENASLVLLNAGSWQELGIPGTFEVARSIYKLCFLYLPLSDLRPSLSRLRSKLSQVRHCSTDDHAGGWSMQSRRASCPRSCLMDASSWQFDTRWRRLSWRKEWDWTWPKMKNMKTWKMTNHSERCFCFFYLELSGWNRKLRTSGGSQHLGMPAQTFSTFRVIATFWK